MGQRGRASAAQAGAGAGRGSVRVVVAEKPSVARDLARVLGATEKRNGYFEGNGLRVTWCVGHLAELANPEHYDPSWKRWALESLPMLPERFEVQPRDGMADHVAILRGLMRAPDVAVVVNACDAGREGELIFRFLCELVDCDKPTLRLWTSSLTDSAVQQAWAGLRPGAEYDALADAARSRSEADWLVGLNATRALTCVTPGRTGVLSVGRVQTPTLAMIVGRDLEIERFVPEAFFTVKGKFQAEGGAWDARWYRQDHGKEERLAEGQEDLPGWAERLATREEAEAVAAAVRGATGSVAMSERKRTVEKPPLLYDLTSLQRRANQRFGFTADRTLQIAQDLYEKHKLLTYPRTDARFLTPDQVPGLPDVVQGLAPIAPYAERCRSLLAAPIRPGRRVVDASEVGDHHAIIPTGRTPDSGRLNPDEKRLFDMVARRFLGALSEDALFDVTELVVVVPPSGPVPESVVAPLHFRARGKVCVQEGWREIDPPPSRGKDGELPLVSQDAAARCEQATALEGQTRPPPAFTDASILRAMETAGRTLDDEELARAMRKAGLGTPATRAAILKTLVDREYVVRKAKELHATERGRAVIQALTVPALKSAELTGRWEGRLSEIADGQASRADFMRDVAGYTAEIVASIAAAPPPMVEVQAETGAVLGACPRCQAPVRERGKVYSCDTGRACNFVVFASMAKRAISARTVRQLLSAGQSEVLKGFKSKAGKAFEAGLRWDEAAGKVVFYFVNDRPESSAPAQALALGVGAPCPQCQLGRLIRGKTALGCERWREGCNFRAPLPA